MPQVGHAPLKDLWRVHFDDPRRERLFLSSTGFFTTFAATRGITHAIRHGVGPFRNITIGGRHFHHMVIGIGLLIATGYAWVMDVALDVGGPGDRVAGSLALAYGAGTALTLDEFALWLNLEDVYWTRQGRESVDAVVLFGAALSMGVWGGPFLRAVARELSHGPSTAHDTVAAG